MCIEQVMANLPPRYLPCDVPMENKEALLAALVDGNRHYETHSKNTFKPEVCDMLTEAVRDVRLAMTEEGFSEDEISASLFEWVPPAMAGLDWGRICSAIVTLDSNPSLKFIHNLWYWGVNNPEIGGIAIIYPEGDVVISVHLPPEAAVAYRARGGEDVLGYIASELPSGDAPTPAVA